MDHVDVYSKLTPIFRDVFDRDDITPVAHMSAADIKEWDSVAHIRLIVAIEEAFGCEFLADEMGTVKNVGELVDLVCRKVRT